MKHAVRKLIGAATCAVLPVLVLPGTAGAARPHEPVEHYSFSYGPFENYDEECDLTFTIEGSQEGRFFAKPVKGSGGQAYLAHDTYRFTETLTTEEGQLTLVARGSFRESAATKVDGPVTYTYTPFDDAGQPLPAETVTSDHVWSFVGKDSGSWTFYGSDGKAVLRYTGLFSVREQFDTLGDGVPGARPVPGTFELLRDKKAWPTDDFCGVLREHLT